MAQQPEETIPASYYGAGWGVSAKISTLGAGLEIVKNFNDRLSLRGGGSFLPVNYHVSKIFDQEANVDNHFKLSSASLILDWYPFRNPQSYFHLSAGGFYNFSSFEINAQPIQDNYLIGDYKVSSEQIGNVNVKVSPKALNPYLGIGTGRLIHKNQRIGSKLEIGCIYIGPPDVKMGASGLVEPTASQEEIIRNNINDYRFYPYLSFQISFNLSK